MNEFVLSLGSNMSAENVAFASEWLLWLVREHRASTLYETPPVHANPKDADVHAPYTNAVVMGKTEFGYDDFAEMLKEYERDCGRDEAARAAGRVPIDIDIVIWNGKIVRERDYNSNFFQIGFLEVGKLES